MSSNSISQLGTDIASKMLSALTFESETPTDVNKENVSMDEQKRYLKRYIDSLTVVDRKAIGNILVINNKRSALNYCSEGTVINIDALPEHVVTQMYSLMVYKISKKT